MDITKELLKKNLNSFRKIQIDPTILRIFLNNFDFNLIFSKWTLLASIQIYY